MEKNNIWQISTAVLVVIVIVLGVVTISLIKDNQIKDHIIKAGNEYSIDMNDTRPAIGAESQTEELQLTAETSENSNLVSTQWLREHINDENLVIIDVRSGETAIKFSDEHIPNSVSASSVYFQIDLPTQTNIPYNIPSEEEFEKLVRDYGVNTDSKIVIVYPGLIPKDVMCGTRTFWTFDYFGVDDVAILDGGFGKWKREGGEITSEIFEPNLGNFSVEKKRTEDLAQMEDVKSAIDNPNVILLDARMTSDYIGKTKQDFIPEYGHITGSINYFAPLFLNPDLTFKSNKQISYEMALLGIKKDKTVIAYCNSGQFATTAWFALKMIADYPNVSSYDGSVSEWVNLGEYQLQKDMNTI